MPSHAILLTVPNDDDQLQRIERRLTAPEIVLIRMTSLWQGVDALRTRMAGAPPLTELDIVGHGEPGGIAVGVPRPSGADGVERTPLLGTGVERQRELAQLLNAPPIVDEATVLRILGCGVGLVRDGLGLPLHASGDGPLLALSLRRRLGCRVQVAMQGLSAHDFGPHGLRDPRLLAEATCDLCCRLQPLDAQGQVPRPAGETTTRLCAWCRQGQ